MQRGREVQVAEWHGLSKVQNNKKQGALARSEPKTQCRDKASRQSQGVRVRVRVRVMVVVMVRVKVNNQEIPRGRTTRNGTDLGANGRQGDKMRDKDRKGPRGLRWTLQAGRGDLPTKYHRSPRQNSTRVIPAPRKKVGAAPRPNRIC